MERWRMSFTWTYFALFIVSRSRSSAYFGLTGREQIKAVPETNEEAAFMAAEEQDSVYLWNEGGYYTAPSNEYERIDLSARPDSEIQLRGSRSKKNAGTRKPDPIRDDQYAPQVDSTVAGQAGSIPNKTRPNLGQPGLRIPRMPHVRRYGTFHRRDAGPRPGYQPRLTRVPRYPRRGPYPVKQIRYPPAARPYERRDAGKLSAPYTTYLPDGRPYRFAGHSSHQAISGPVQSVDIEALIASRYAHSRRRYYRPSAAVSGKDKPGGGSSLQSTQNDEAARSYSKGHEGEIGYPAPSDQAPKSVPDATHAKRNDLDRYIKAFAEQSARDAEKPAVPGDSTVGPGEVKPLFVTKDIPSIMAHMGLDEKGQPYVKAGDEVDPSSFSSTHASDAGSRATDLSPMVPSSEINKKDARRECDDLQLTKKQRKLCKKDPGLPQVLREATATSIAECQHQFRFERWNCTTGNTRINLLSKGSRETAFLFAISSAGLTHSIARACAEGHLERCSCDETYSDHVNQEAWMWGGCGDNVQAAAKFARRFLKPKMRSMDIRAEVDKHNSDLGIRVVRQSMEKTCKCHGVSGSCTTKTCWRKVAPFYEIGDRIKSAYNRSVKVASVNSAEGRPKLVRLRRTRRNRPEIRPSVMASGNQTAPWPRPTSSPHEADAPRGDFPGHLRNSSARQARRGGGALRVEHRHLDVNPRGNELVYHESSPTYCRRTRYSLGTKGRLCDKERNCEEMCCGRGYTTQTRIVRRSCQCEVRWCCYVECKTCTERREVHICK